MLKYETSPSMTDLYKPVPPSFLDPFPSPENFHRIGRALVEDHRPTERENVKKRIIVEDVDKSARLSIASRSMF